MSHPVEVFLSRQQSDLSFLEATLLFRFLVLRTYAMDQDKDLFWSFVVENFLPKYGKDITDECIFMYLRHGYDLDELEPYPLDLFYSMRGEAFLVSFVPGVGCNV